MLRKLIFFITISSSLVAQGHAYLQPGDRLSFCGVLQNERRLDLIFLQTYVATRFPQSEQSLAYSDSNPFSKQTGGRMPGIILLLSTAPPPPKVQGSPQVSNSSCLGIHEDQRSNIRVGVIAFEDPAVGPQVRSVESKQLWPELAVGGTEFHLWRDPPLQNSGPDSPNRSPGLVATLQLLQLWNAPASVSSVEISLPTLSVASENTTVRELVADRFVGWTQDEKALPLPLSFVADSAPLSGPVRNMDVQNLRVVGLPGTKYALTIDGERIVIFTKDQLERGVNLALFPTPMTRQADRVLALTRDYFNSASKDHDRFVDELRSAAKPQTHDYELQPLDEN